MQRILLLLLLLFVSVLVDAYGRHNPRFPKSSDENKNDTNVGCREAFENERYKLIQKSSCGDPKEVFVDLKPAVSYEQLNPSSVWVKRCVGSCHYAATGSKCVATETRVEQVPVRILNVKTGKESCSFYDVEVHVSCACCGTSHEKCELPRVLNRKCSCQCPNLEERRQCLKKRTSYMRWNRRKCVCEKKRRGAW